MNFSFNTYLAPYTSYINKLQAVVGAVSCADAAMMADYRGLCFFVKIYGIDYTCLFTLTAADAFVRFEQNSSAVAKHKGVTRAYFHTCGF